MPVQTLRRENGVLQLRAERDEDNVSTARQIDGGGGDVVTRHDPTLHPCVYHSGGGLCRRVDFNIWTYTRTRAHAQEGRIRDLMEVMESVKPAWEIKSAAEFR